MGKHKNSYQENIFISFMENHQDLARGFMKGDRVAAEALWSTLAKDLNSHGPPQKDATGWKKVWMDWKINIRKKLAHNKAENISTGGGPFNKYPISSIEDAVARLSGIYVVIESDPNTMDFGVEDENNEISHAFQTQNEASTTQAQSEPSIEPSTTENLRRKRSQPSTSDNLNKYMFEQTTQIAHISEYMKEILEQSKNIVKTSKFIESDLRKLHKSVESLNDTLKKTKEENMRHNLVMEKCRLEELSIKKRKIEIEEMKLSIERSSK